MTGKDTTELTDEERLLTDFQQNHTDHNTTNDDEAIDDVFDEYLDIFDMALAYQDDGRDPSIADVPVRLTKDELLEAQSTDDFCQTVLSRKSRNLCTHFFEGNDGLLRRRHPTDSEIVQIVLPDTLRPRVLDLAHHTTLAGHPGQTRMHRHIRETYYWPQMVTDICKTIRNCTNCAKNRVKLRKRTHPLRIFRATRPAESLAINILGPLTKTREGHRFRLVMSDRFSKLTHVVPLRRIDSYTVAVAFFEALVFKYGPRKALISDNGKQFAAKFFQAVCSLLGISNIFTSTYHPQTNGRVERYNRTILAMLRNCVNEHQNDWDRYATALTYSSKCHVHRSTNMTPFNLLLSRPLPEFSLHHSVKVRAPPTAEQKNYYARILDDVIQTAYSRLMRTQQRYKRDCDRRIKKIQRNIREGDYVYIDPTDGMSKTGKLESPALGPFRILKNDGRTVIIQRNQEVERINGDSITYALPPENAPPPEAFAPTGNNIEKNTEGTTYVVDNQLKHRVTSEGTLKFRVKWFGYTEQT